MHYKMKTFKFFAKFLKKLKKLFTEYHKAISQRQVLDGQLHENLGVKQVFLYIIYRFLCFGFIHC